MLRNDNGENTIFFLKIKSSPSIRAENMEFQVDTVISWPRAKGSSSTHTHTHTLHTEIHFYENKFGRLWIKI